MSDEKTVLKGPDLTQGIELSMIADGTMLLGHARGEPVLLARRGDELFAIGAICTHYGAPLETGLLVGDTVRCPWHHACFSLRTGEALRAPALPPVSCWRVSEVRHAARQFTPAEQPVSAIYVSEKLERVASHVQPARAGMPASVLIVGGGAAGNAAAETLRREGYGGRITMLSADDALPCDRPNLSKGYLAGTASEASNLLRSTNFYKDHGIDVRLGTRVAAIDVRSGYIELADGERLSYGALLLATGADPVRLDVPGGHLPHVHYLRTLADSRALISKVLTARRAVVIGASFIGLEVAASLRARNVEVQVIAPEKVPMEKILGPELGNFIRRLHESHGVSFHLGTTAVSIDERSVSLKDGARLEADLVLVGIGVRPAISLAEKAGLAIDRGVTVNEYLETSAPGVYAAGDIARWPDRLTEGAHPHRALRRGRTPGTDGRAQHSRPARAVRRRPILLDRTVRPRRCLCRARGAVGPSRDRRATRGARLHADLPAGRQEIGSRRHSPRSRGSSRGGGFRKSNRGAAGACTAPRLMGGRCSS
jgi:NADPH-dependent 2,4-dienoyl-CoA reductase/sulfur reductase-like enzyme/nitrite reductase/ring-hydroxylating ferredoxin subunit